MLSVRPMDLSAFLDGRLYAAIKVSVVNVLIFVLADEAVCRIGDPIFARSGLFGNRHSPADLKANVPTVGSIKLTNSQGFRNRDPVFDRTSSRLAIRLPTGQELAMMRRSLRYWNARYSRMPQRQR
jgi:hypothetical protein